MQSGELYELAEVQAYVYVLKQYKAFLPCDGTLHKFVMQELDSNSEHHLKVSKMLLVAYMVYLVCYTASPICLRN